MKRIIAAISFAALAVPAFAFAAEIAPPFEKTQFDRTLPNVQNPVVNERVTAGATSAPTEGASAGSTNAPGSGWATGPWANDPNFIAPAQ
jgi:hypothetical protein